MPGSERASHCPSFLRATCFLNPENQAAVEALIDDIDLEFMGRRRCLRKNLND